MRYREVAARLGRLGCEELRRRGGGSHRRWRNPANGMRTVVPDHGGKDLRPGLLAAILRQLGIDREDFDDA